MRARFVSLHVRPIQFVSYVEDHLHADSPKGYKQSVTDAISHLWPKFRGGVEDPFDRSLIEVMSYLSTAYEEGYEEKRIIEDVLDEVEEIFEEAGNSLLDSEIPFNFYLFCTAFYDYLYEEEQIEEIDDYNIQMCIINHNRVDLTFY